MSVEDFIVLVDKREPLERGKNYVSTYDLVLKQYPNAIIVQLEVGDIVYKNIAIELKTWDDFIKGITAKGKENRFKNQLYNFFLNKEIDGYYFIYGSWNDINKHSQIKMQAVLGAIASIQARYGVRVNIFPNKQYAVYVACKIIAKAHDKKEIRPVTYKVSTDDRAIAMLLNGAERFQEKAVKNALEEFGTVKNVVNSTPKELEKVRNIGKETIKRFFETINYDFKQKLEFEQDFEEEFSLIDVEADKIE